MWCHWPLLTVVVPVTCCVEPVDSFTDQRAEVWTSRVHAPFNATRRVPVAVVFTHDSTDTAVVKLNRVEGIDATCPLVPSNRAAVVPSDSAPGCCSVTPPTIRA